MTSGSLNQGLGRYTPAVGGVTDLVVSGITFPDYAVRGLKVRIGLAEQASRLERTVNGRLINLSETVFRKRIVTISGSDVEFPYFEDIWPGDAVTVTTIISASAGGSPISVVGMVKNLDMERDEYGAVSTWNLEIWEI